MDLIPTTPLPLQETTTIIGSPFDYQVLVILETTIYSVGAGSFALFGVVSNVINVVVFCRQGILSNSSMVNLTGLAVSDFFNCLFTVFGAVLKFIHYFYPNAGYFHATAYSLLMFAVSRPLEVTMQTTCWITAMTALERVIAVVFPFKVKSIVTPRRSLVVVIAIFTVTFILSLPFAFNGYLTQMTHQETNYTYIGYVFADIPPILITLYFFINPVVMRFTAILVVAICNFILFWKVNLSQKFRKKAVVKIEPTTITMTDSTTSVQPGSDPRGPGSNKGVTSAVTGSNKGVTSAITGSNKGVTSAITGSNKGVTSATTGSNKGVTSATTGSNKGVTSATTGSNKGVTSAITGSNKGVTSAVKTKRVDTRQTQTKEMKLLRMITVVSLVFTLCYIVYIPFIILYWIVWVHWEDVHLHEVNFAWKVTNFSQIINSSTNIIIYYIMSSRFKEEFDKLFYPRGAGSNKGVTSATTGSNKGVTSATTGSNKGVTSAVTGSNKGVTSAVTGSNKGVTSAITGSNKGVTSAVKAKIVDTRQTQTKEMKLLRMITVVSLVFTLCYIVYVPFIILYWIVWVHWEDVHLHEVNFAWKVTNFFQIINSSTNIIIYYIMSSRFKEEFDKLFYCAKRK